MLKPIAVVAFLALWSMSPQQGFLHEEAEVDTLGVDEPETKCKFK